MVAMLSLQQQLGQQVFVTTILMMALHLKKMMTKKTQSKQRMCDCTCKTFDHSGTLDDDGKEHIVLGARSPKGQD
jgi:hypothetical protein